MAKRSASMALDTELESKVVTKSKKEGKKHSLDSDEEDSGAEEEKQNVLNADDIEGEEDGIAGVEGEVSSFLLYLHNHI
jgi:CD2 antigen cytoplasmic tail-binding protein 2